MNFKEGISSAFTTMWEIVKRGGQATWAKTKANTVKMTLFVSVCIVSIFIFPTESKEQLALVFDTWTNWNNEVHTEGGIIRVSTPRVYTRERLVNDRFEEATWVKERLDKTNEFLEIGSFAKPDSTMHQSINRYLKSSSTVSQVTPSRREDNDLTLPPLGEFQQAAQYREELRHRLIGEYLDDAHDIDGNTLYRFDFNTTVLPPPRSNFVAAIQIDISEAQEKKVLLKQHYQDLLADWRDDVNQEARTILADRIRTIEMGAELSEVETNNLTRFIDCRMWELIFKKKIGPTVDKECFLGERIPKEEMELLASLKRYAIIKYREMFMRKVRQEIKSKVEEGSKEFELKNNDFLKRVNNLTFSKYRQTCAKTQGRYPLPGVVDDKCASNPRNIKLLITMDILDLLLMLRSSLSNESGNASKYMRSLVKNAVNPFLLEEKDPSTVEPEGDDVDLSNWLQYERLAEKVAKESKKVDEKKIQGLYKSMSHNDRRHKIIANYVINVFNYKKPRGTRKIGVHTYFKFNITGCSTGVCTILAKVREESEVSRKPHCSDMFKVNRPKDKLINYFWCDLNYGAHARTYRVIPEEKLNPQQLSIEDHAQIGVESFEIDAGANRWSSHRSIKAVSSLVGFSDWGYDPSESNSSEKHIGTTKFAWVVLPDSRNAKTDQPAPIHEGVSALVSLPSWWRLVNFKMRTCWLSRSLLRKDVRADDLCPEQDYKEDTKQRSKEVTTRLIKIPGTSTDISHRLRYQVIDYPYVEHRHVNNIVEVGRKAKLTITGRRLWKNPRVKLGNQWATRVEVLPDMKGLNIEFECLHPSPGKKGSANIPEEQRSSTGNTAGAPKKLSSSSLLHVWTSEGRANPMVVDIVPFQNRLGEEEGRPCWL